MTAFVDTNVIVRHLTGEPPELAERATRYLASGERLLLTDLILAETVYVLESFYEVPVADVARAARSLVTYGSVTCVDVPLLLRAIETYESERLDFADAYLVACAESTGVGRVASFDRAIDRAPTVERVEPPA
ncbi:MAG: PIN domain-containing protein [Acidimicrobiales bacterium]